MHCHMHLAIVFSVVVSCGQFFIAADKTHGDLGSIVLAHVVSIATIVVAPVCNQTLIPTRL